MTDSLPILTESSSYTSRLDYDHEPWTPTRNMLWPKLWPWPTWENCVRTVLHSCGVLSVVLQQLTKWRSNDCAVHIICLGIFIVFSSWISGIIKVAECFTGMDTVWSIFEPSELCWDMKQQHICVDVSSTHPLANSCSSAAIMYQPTTLLASLSRSAYNHYRSDALMWCNWLHIPHICLWIICCARHDHYRSVGMI